MGLSLTAPPPLILVADGDDDNRDLLACLLRDRHFETAEATNGRELIDSAVRLRPQLILTELRLREIDGLHAAARLKADPLTAAIPIVAVTGYTIPHYEDEARRVGIERVLLKPCSIDDLLETCGRLLQQSQAVREECATLRASSAAVRDQAVRSREESRIAVERAREIAQRLTRKQSGG